MNDEYSAERMSMMMGYKVVRPEQIMKLPPMPDFDYVGANASIDWRFVLLCALLGSIAGALIGHS